MKISEIFYSIQGEGALIGVPSVFVRTTGCNLRCVWCDTPYTSWSPQGEHLSVEEIVARVRAYDGAHVVLTGGEPMIAPELPRLTNLLRNANVHITIETAGTVFQELDCDLMSISPKLSNSTPYEREGGRWASRHESLRFQPEILRALIHRYPYQLKFVVTSESDLAEIEAIRNAIEAPRSNVLLMPEGTERDLLRERGLVLVEICKKMGFRFSPRLHVDLWGDRRGV